MSSATTTVFGSLLRRHRRAAGLTQQDLAERAGLAARAISDLERGARNHPYRDTVIRLADALDVSEPVRSEFFAAARRTNATSNAGPGSDVSESIRPRTDLPDSSRPETRHNLPVPLSTFVGRERELADVRHILLGQSSTSRLLTLTGPPGTGKTRLAIAAGLDLVNDFCDGVFFVPLAAITDSRLVSPAIARGCGFPGFGGSNLVERLSRDFRGKRILLVIDNFEQVTAAAPLVARLLEDCPTLKTLVTSRSRLHLRGERELAIPPLPVPDPIREQTRDVDSAAHAIQNASVRLFVDRAREARPDFELTNENAPVVAEICRQLDGLPLAIELAAGRGKILSPEAILDHLQHRFDLLTSGPADLPLRQQTLHQAIAWSYDLLDPSDQQLFRQLAVFVGGFTLRSAFLLTADDPEARSLLADSAGRPTWKGKARTPGDLLRGVETLVDRSLVNPVEGGARFRMLETIREFGLERLAARAELETLRRRHAACFRALVEEAVDQLRGHDEGQWIHSLERDLDNLRAALRFLIDSGDVDQALRLGSHLERFWRINWNYQDASVWFEELLALTKRSTNAAYRARMLWLTAHAAYRIGNFSVARVRFTEALAISREIGDRKVMAESLAFSGLVARDQGDYGQALTWFTESLGIWRELGNQAEIGAQLDRIGLIAFYQGDPEAARSLLEESLEIRRRLNYQISLGWALHELARVRHGQGDNDEARFLFDECLEIWREQGNSFGIALVLGSLGDLALDRNEISGAVPLLIGSLRLFRDLGQSFEIAHVLELFAGVAAAENRAERSVRLAGAAAAIRLAIGAPIPPDYRARLERRLAGPRRDLGEHHSVAATAEGQRLTLEQAVDLALEDVTSS